MTNTCFSTNRVPYTAATIALGLVIALMLLTVNTGLSHAADKTAAGNRSAAEKQVPIQITADQLISDNNEKYAEFIGNVNAVQGDWVINSDRLRIYFASGGRDQTGAAQGSFRQIVASGNVRIKFDNKVAVTERAVYTRNTDVLVLSGANSKVVEGRSSIVGEKITVDRGKGKTSVEGGKDGTQVSVKFFTSEQSLTQ